MSLLPVNSSALPDACVLQAALAGLDAAAPVIIMLHGYRFSPTAPTHDPHQHILSETPASGCWKALSWPRHLGLAGEKGLAIGFGWEARGTIWQAHRQAALEGARLARLVTRLRQIAPDRPVHVLAHSLGARVAFAALEKLPAHAVQRLVLLAAALSRAQARRCMASPAGKTAEVINVVGRENAVFDVMLFLAMPRAGMRLRRQHIAAPNWLDLPLDTRTGLRGLAALGYPIKAPALRICHWSTYLRPGVWRLYRALLLTPAQTPLGLLREQVAKPSPQKNRRGLLPFYRQSPS